MTHRRLTIILHWTLFLLLLAMIKGGTSAPLLRWGFVLAGAGWVLMALLRGLRARPGPRLKDPLRALFTPLHWGMMGLVAAATLANAAALLAIVPQVWAWNSLLVLFVAGLFHSILHLWRHTALNDGALRMILPRAWQKHL